MAVGVGRVALTVVVAHVERQEARGLPVEPSRHRDGVRVHREVHERAAGQRDVLWVAVVAVLRDRLFDALASEMVLQLRRRHRDAVEEQAQVHRLVGVGVEGQLPGHGQAIGVVVRRKLRREFKRRLAVGESNLDVLVTHAVPYHVQCATLIDLLREALQEALARVGVLAAVRLHQLLPLPSLSLFDEGEQLAGVETERRVEVGPPSRIGTDLAGAVAAVGNKMGCDLILKQLLGDATHAASGMSIWPVTAAVIMARRRS